MSAFRNLKGVSAVSLATLLCTIALSNGSETITIEVPGTGHLRCNINSNNVTECLGIPFAAPPVGMDRFRPPQALPESKHGEVDATSYGWACPQRESNSSGVKAFETNENCLNLNIWLPPLRDNRSDLAVFFWIHGGGFDEGSGRLYNLSRLAKQGVVAVSINYRLGALGWLPLEAIAQESPQAPSNGGINGFLDQLAALRWVRQNIAAFGADPSKITIAGESAGSQSVCAHLHLPESQGLFHRAILESGSCSKGPWGWRNFDGSRGEAIAPAYLRAVGAEDLEALRQTPLEMLLGTELFMFVPGPDGWFMPREPSQLQMLTKGIEVIIGSNTMDSLNSATLPFYTTTPWYEVTHPITTATAYASTVGSYLGADGLHLYPVPQDASAETVSNSFRRLTADVCNTCPKLWLAQKLLAAGNAVYMYNFGFYAKAPLQGLACHACEMQDVLDTQVDLGSVTTFLTGAYNKDLAAAMSGYWVSFTKSGRPQGKVDWPKYHGSATDAQSLDISTDAAGKPWIHVERGLAAPQCAFFEQFVDDSKLHKGLFSDLCFFNGSVPLPSSSDTVLV